MTYRQLIMELEALAMLEKYDSKQRDVLMCAANVINSFCYNKGTQK